MRQKRLANLDRRGLDFEDADLVFDGRPVTTAESLRNNEDRFVLTAEIGGKLYTVVWMWQGANQRIISFRGVTGSLPIFPQGRERFCFSGFPSRT